MSETELKNVLPWDILYTTFDYFEDCDGAFDPPVNQGQISICVKEIIPYNGKLMVMAQGQYMYDPKDLTSQKPAQYTALGEGFLKYRE